jgi:DnaJ-domain-containing protein 1
MGDGAALRLALDLLYVPWRVRLVRSEPLPEGVPLLLRIAAGDAAAQQEAVKVAGRPPEVIRQAATFFIEQILLSPEADSYRVLGASPDAADSELRRNMASLMTWLHPDLASENERSLFAPRIATAWNDLKTPERRAAYDSGRQAAHKAGKQMTRRARFRTGMPGSKASGKFADAWASKTWESRKPSAMSPGSRLRRALLFLLLGRNHRRRRF